MFTRVGAIIGPVVQVGNGSCLCGGVRQLGLCVPSTLGTAVLFWSQVTAFGNATKQFRVQGVISFGCAMFGAQQSFGVGVKKEWE